jgi:peptidylprolyl isomerase
VLLGSSFSHLMRFLLFYLRNQVFICTADTPWLNGKHCVFGKVTSGLDVVRKIETFGNDRGSPLATIKISNSGAL